MDDGAADIELPPRCGAAVEKALALLTGKHDEASADSDVTALTLGRNGGGDDEDDEVGTAAAPAMAAALSEGVGAAPDTVVVAVLPPPPPSPAPQYCFGESSRACGGRYSLPDDAAMTVRDADGGAEAADSEETVLAPLAPTPARPLTLSASADG